MDNYNNHEKMLSVSKELKSEMGLRLTTAEYMLWISPIQPVQYDGTKLTYIAPSDNAVSTLTSNYLGRFLDAARDLALPVTDIEFVPMSESEKYLVAEENKGESEPKPRVNPFVPKYTFENFVVGGSNRMAFEIAQTVAKAPGINDGLLSMNPFYIYGGVGLGKTHLLHAIGNYLYENSPETNVKYTSADRLSNEYFASLNHYTTDKDAYRNFRSKYAECDVLMIDDVQFLQKKGGLQEVFFHIFNDLYQAGKQIILSSDRPPKETNNTEDRLRTRFMWGMTTDIGAPEYDTRIYIIRKKLEGCSASLSDDIVCYIADKIDTNVRELEGALLKVVKYSQLTRRPPTIEVAKEALKESVQSNEHIDSDRIINFVAEYFHLTSTDLIGKKKTKNIAEARMIAIYLVCELLNLPLVTVGQLFGGRDHTTVIYSRDKIATALNEDKTLRNTVEDIKNGLNCK